jgi:hypothetical protein
MYCTGRQAAFGLIGLGLLKPKGGSRASPTRHVQLILGALTEQDIHDVYEQTELSNGEKLRDVLRVKNSWLLCQKIHVVTGGVPRYVHYCFNALVTSSMPLNTNEQIERALDAAYEKAKLTARDLLFGHQNVTGPLGKYFHTLVFVATLHQPVDVSRPFFLPNGSKLYLEHLVHMFGLFLDNYKPPSTVHEMAEKQKQLVLVCFPVWSMRHLMEESNHIMPLFIPLARMPAGLLGQGEPLEWVVRTRLAIQLSLAQGRYWQEVFNVLSNTMVARVVVQLDEKRPVCCIPKVTSSHSSGPLHLSAWWLIFFFPRNRWPRAMIPAKIVTLSG